MYEESKPELALKLVASQNSKRAILVPYNICFKMLTPATA